MEILGDRPFQEMPIWVIMVEAMPAITKTPGFATVTSRLLGRENRMLKIGPESSYHSAGKHDRGPLFFT